MKTGYIYEIKNLTNDKIYIGSTEMDINQRYCRHMSAFVRYNKRIGQFNSSFEILSYGNSSIHLIEEVQYNDKSFLRERENYHIIRNIDFCVNKRNAIFKYDDYYRFNKDRIKKYYQDNKDSKKAYQKQRYNRLKNNNNDNNNRNNLIINIELIRDF